MQDFWEESYGTDITPLPENQRNEKLGFIIKNGDIYSIQNISATDVSSCHISPGDVTIPSNAVGILHTHPYADGDKLKDPRCLAHNNYNLEEHNGQYPTYNAANESRPDRNLVTNTDLPLYVMDKNDIHVLKPSNPYQYEANINRCGY